MTTTPMSLDFGSSSHSHSQEMEVEPIAQVGEAIKIIDSVYEHIDTTTTWNKRQCQRLLRRFSDIRDRFKSMEWDRRVDAPLRRASDGGPIYDELVQLLQKGKTLVLGYVAGKAGIANVLSRTDNREAFEEINEDLDTVEAKLGLQNLEEDVELTTTTAGFLEKLSMMKEEAEEDKKEMPQILSQMQSQGEATMEFSEKLAKVVSDKTVVDEDVTELVDESLLLKSADESDLAGASNAVPILPSYLRIDLKSEIVKGKLIREYERLSEHDPEEEVGWAAVHVGTWLGFHFAIKAFKCGAKDGQGGSAWNRRQLLKEAGSLVKLQHPHVVRLVGFGQDDNESIFVMELMDGDLRQLMKSQSEKLLEGAKPFTSSEELNIINQIAKGMYFMHTKGYVHGDLKCSNIVYKRFAKQHLEVKLSDFRGALKLDPESDKVVDPKACEEASKTRRPRWTAPEAIDHYGGSVEPTGKLLKAGDVYSFGMTCYEIVTGKYPFDGRRGAHLLEQIKEGAAKKWNPFPPEVDEGLKGLITSCWDKEPSKRPTFGLICHHLNMISSKGLPAEKNQSDCGGMVARLFSQIKQIPVLSGVRRRPEVQNSVLGAGDKLPKLSNCFESASERTRNNKFISAPEYEYLSIQPKQLKRLERIGGGSSSHVYKATWLNNTFAVKTLRYQGCLELEVDFLMKVSRHPCIVQMVGLSRNANGEDSIVMEYMDGNLRTLIQTRMRNKSGTEFKPFTSSEEVLIITTIAWGMAYLHSRGLVHRDLNTLNILAQDYSQTVDVKIVDFGWSHLEVASNSGETHSYYTGVGTSCFRAPEMLKFDPKSQEKLPAELPDPSAKADLSALKATDVYSFAMVCYEVLTGRCPCSERSSGKYDVTEYAAWRTYRPKYWPESSDAGLKSLVENCWSMNPKERPTFREICNLLLSQFKSNQLQIETPNIV